jgi:DNA replication protein DnaC
MSEFSTEVELKKRYEKGMGFSLESEAAKPLLVKYSGGEGERRYYQDAAIRAALEKIAQGKNRVLLSLATGVGKTFIAVNLLRRIADAGLLLKSLISFYHISTDGTEVFDRKELFSVYDVMLSEGIDALKKGGDAAALLRQAKERMFAA